MAMTQQQQGHVTEERFTNYKKAVETGQSCREREHRCRLDRYQHFNEYNKSVDSAGCENALQRFVDRERKGVMAKCQQPSVDDFEGLRVLGEGAFGIVHLVRRKGTEEYYALKQTRKACCKKKHYRESAFAERDLLAAARSKWFVELFKTFQDVEHIYMLMEFVQGGDLLFHLERRGRFTIEETQFYMAELLEALDTVHKCGFVHRDVKPDNIVLTAAGHLKLLDFGLCKQDPGLALDAFAAADKSFAQQPHSRRTQLKTVLGTPQYMAPEVYAGGTGIDSDIWSLGIITFECLVGHAPFFTAANSDEETGLQMIKDSILKHHETLPKVLETLVEKQAVKRTCAKFLLNVLCDRAHRFTAEQCRRDPFFFGIDFPRLHVNQPPIIPEVRSAHDATYFDNFDAHELPSAMHSAKKDSALEWAHFEFNRDAHELQRPCLNDSELFCGSSKARTN